jgi:uncharacterized protein
LRASHFKVHILHCFLLALVCLLTHPTIARHHQAKQKESFSRPNTSRAGDGCMRVIPLDSLPDEALVGDVSMMGAPSVHVSSPGSSEAELALAAVRAVLMACAPGGAAVPELAAVICTEVGGGNCLLPLVVSSRLGLPIVDADLTGRAFPELQMSTPAIYGLPVAPAALVDSLGNEVVVQSAQNAEWLERLLRAACAAMGGCAGLAGRPLAAAKLRKVAVPGSLSRAWRLGVAADEARRSGRDPAAVVADTGGGVVLFRGAITFCLFGHWPIFYLFLVGDASLLFTLCDSRYFVSRLF